jgi:hypothetical protein
MEIDWNNPQLFLPFAEGNDSIRRLALRTVESENRTDVLIVL